MVKVVKLKVVKPVNTDWQTFGKIVREFDTLSWRIKNYAVTMYRDILQAEEEHNRLNPQNKFNGDLRQKVYGYRVIQSKIYNDLMPKIENLLSADKHLNTQFKRSKLLWNSQIYSALIRDAIATYDKIRKDIFTGRASTPSFKPNQPTNIPHAQIKIKSIETLTLSLLNPDGGKFHKLPRQKGTSAHPILLKVASRKGHAKTVIRRLMAKEYKICDSKLITKNNEIFILLAYQTTSDAPKQVAVDKNKILGIDLGIAKAVTMQVGSTPKHEFINGGEITRFRERTENDRISKRNQLKYCSDNRRGHGRKTLLQPVLDIGDKIDRFRETVNHRYSKHIIDTAIKNDCGTIQMEDLSGISKDNSFLANWSYYDLQQKVKYKAEDVGIDVVLINPHHTSQRCHKCGVIDKNSRKSQDIFQCTTCNHRTNADLNAARNIAIKDIENIIKKQIKS